MFRPRFQKAVVFAVLLFFAGAARGSQQITATTGDERQGTRNSAASRGRILWYDDDGTVWLYNGSTNVPVQEKGDLGNVENNVFMLGSGATGTDVIGAWRRGTDFAWLSTNGGTAVLVTATNPINANDPTNPEGVAIADGCVFMALQAFANAKSVQHIFRIDPVTGAATNLTGTDPVPGRSRLLSTSECKAVWLFDDLTDVPGTGGDTGIPRVPIYKLHYYDGASVTTIDQDATLGQPMIHEGLIVYTKDVGKTTQVFSYDTGAASPIPVQLSHNLPSRSLDPPRTDGRRVAWTSEKKSDQTDRHVILNGDVVLTDATSRLADGFLTGNRTFEPVQLDHGQLLWTDVSGNLRFAHDGAISTIPIAPATTHANSWLADAFVAWLGTSNDGGADVEVFRHTAPASVWPGRPFAISATPGMARIDVAWERILGVTYNLYMAEATGVTKDNYASLAGGRRFEAATSPFGIDGLSHEKTYFFTVTAVEGGVETASSREASATPLTPGIWVPAFGPEGLNVYDVTVDRANGAMLYAATNGSNPVWKSIDGGSTWTPAEGAVNGRDVRAVASNGTNVIAVTKDGDILRSIDGGTTWNVVADGIDIGEQQKAVLFSPVDANIIYASDVSLTGSPSTFVVKSVNGGANWTQLPDSPAGDIRAYALAADGATLYASGTGVPVAKSVDGGTSWTNVQPAAGYFYTMESNPPALFAAGTNFSAQSIGIYRTTNGGTGWTPVNTGLPSPLPRINAIQVDPDDADFVYAGADEGFFYSSDGGTSWSSGPGGSSLSINALAASSTPRLVAGTIDGIRLLTLSASPEITSATPSSGPEVGGTAVTLAGSGFNPAAGLQVRFGASDATVDLGASSATSLAVTAPPHAPGAVHVTVINPDGQTDILTNGYTYVACAPILDRFNASFSSAAASGMVNVTVTAGCAWTATAPGGSFVTITGGASGSGNGTVTYSLTQNTGNALMTTLTIAGKSFVVMQRAAGATAPVLTAAAATASVDVSWTAAGGTTFDVYRSSGGGAFSLIATTASTNYTDTAVSAGTAYLYVVSSQLAFSNVDIAVPFAYTDPLLVAGLTKVRAVHFTEMRQTANAAWAAIGWPPYAYADTNLAGVRVKTLHLTQLRATVNAVRVAIGLPGLTFTDATPTVIRKVHVEELRAGTR